MEKLIEHTYGSHIYMKLRLDNNRIEEVDCYISKDGGMRFVTSAEHGAELDKTEEEKRERENRRLEILMAFAELY